MTDVVAPLLSQENGDYYPDEHASIVVSSESQSIQDCAEDTIATKSDAPEVVRQTGFWAAVFLLANAILGSGALGQAYAVQGSGLIIFSLFLIAMGGAAYYAIFLLLLSCETVGVHSYEALGESAYRFKGRIAASIAIMVQNFSAMSSYLIIIGDIAPGLLHQLYHGVEKHDPEHSSEHDPWWTHRTFVILIVVIVVVLPLTVPRRIGILGYSSGLSISVMVIFSIISAAKAPAVHCPPDPSEKVVQGGCEIELVHLAKDTFYVLPTIAFSFVCHTALLPIYSELKDRTPKSMGTVAATAMGSCFLVYIVAGFSGYWAFRQYVLSDSLKSFSEYNSSDRVLIGIRTLVCCAVCCTIPLINFPFRRALILLTCPRRVEHWTVHIPVGLLTVGLVTLVSILVPNIRTIFGAAGATSSMTLVFILPGLFFYKLHRGKPELRPHLIGSVILCGTGVIVGIVSLTGIIMSWVEQPARKV